MNNEKHAKPHPKVLIAADEGHITEVEMIKGLRNSGIDIHAALASTSPHLRTLINSGVPTRTLDLKNNADFRSVLKIRKWIKNEGFQILHGLANKQVANFVWASYGLPNMLIAYRGAIGHISRLDPTCYLKWLNPRIDKIICVSQAVQHDLASNGAKPSKLITIYKGHDLSWYSHNNRQAARLAVEEEFNIPKDAFLIGIVANMRPIKGTDLLINALEMLPRSAHALIIGEIRDNQLLNLIDQSSVKDRIHCTGYRSDATALIGALDVNCAPSRGREGLTKTVIEGMAQAVPAVVSNAGGLPEMINHGESGYIFPVDDLEKFAQYLNELIASPTLKNSLGRNGQKLAQQRFNINNTIKSTATLYESFLLN